MTTVVHEFRNTGMGGLTIPIAVCIRCRDLIEPYERRLSRRGTHGEYFFEHDHTLTLIVFRQSNNSLNRSYSVDGPKEPWMDAVGQKWVFRKLSVDALTTEIDFYLKEAGPVDWHFE